MAKKMTAKERREAQKTTSSAYKGMQAVQAKQMKEAEEKRILEEKAAEEKAAAERAAKEQQQAELADRCAGSKKKTVAKACGLKSTFRVKDRVVMTSFGKGNEAIVEKRIDGESVETVNNPPVFNVTVPQDAAKYLLEGLRMRKTEDGKPAVTDKPSASYRMDAAHIRPMLEKQYFGREFPDDNIHVQVAYNLLDVVKTLTVHSNNVVYEITNLARNTDEKTFDYMGYLSIRNPYEEWRKNEKLSDQHKWFDKLIKMPQLAYFGKAFYRSVPGKKNSQKPSYVPKSEREIYAILALLGSVRQVCTHATIGTKSGKNVDWLFRLDEPGAMTDEVRSVLNGVYEDAVKSVNRDFISNNKSTNFAILKLMYPNEDPAAYVPAFYDFIVRKSFKNLGFSIRTLREAILLQDDELVVRMNGKEYDTMRSKLYQLFDFSLSRYYSAHPERQEEIVSKLRSLTSAEEKVGVYVKEAANVWGRIRPEMKVAVGQLEGTTLKKLQAAGKEDKTDYNALIGDKLSAETPTFCKLMYLLTMLLDGKEINDLLTTLIHKFENVASFCDTMRELGLDADFAPGYEALGDSWKIAGGLRLINSFCRMQKPLPAAKQAMYKEALLILGIQMPAEELNRLVDKILCVEYDEKTRKSKTIPGEKGFRNFLANNVIESSRFRYLIRYSDPAQVRKLASNRALIRFQLERLPDTQIDRYYTLCIGKSDAERKEKIAALADIIHNVDYSEFEKVKQNTKGATQEEIADKDRKRAIISLYLTMLYLVVKNLVYVNSRYVMAFEAVERDNFLHELNQTRFTALTEKCLAEHWLKKHPQTYMEENYKQLNDKNGRVLISFFRAKAAHLNVLTAMTAYVSEMGEIHSYYGIYHYVMQRMLLDNIEEKEQDPKPIAAMTETMLKWKDGLNRFHSYNKDMVKALCVPFGYNLPRYKNLTIEDLFDMNEQPKIAETAVAE